MFADRSPYDLFVLVRIAALARRRIVVAVFGAGVIGGVFGAGYLWALRGVSNVIGAGHYSNWVHLPMLVGVGVVVALLVRWLGAPDDVELLVGNIHVLGGPREVKGLRSLIPASLLCVGVGGPLGPEAPLVTATGTFGSLLAHRQKMSPNEVRMIAITGMAAGFTVLFGAPLGSALFALEILHRRGMEYYEALMPSLVGSLVGYGIAALARAVGLEPLWHFPHVTALRPGDFGWAIAAGAIGAVVAIAFTWLTIGLRRAIAVIPPSCRPALGGLVIGLGAFVTPYMLTNGEVQINELLDHRVVVGTLAVAAVAKLCSASIAVVTGFRGGFIIPLFFIGFALGRLTEGHLPGGNSMVFAIALMVACNVGVTKTPLGSTLVVTEMAGFAILPTTLTAAMIALVLTSGVNLIHSQQRRLNVDAPGARTRIDAASAPA
jgi:H+/Cl- antiporter ClcA